MATFWRELIGDPRKQYNRLGRTGLKWTDEEWIRAGENRTALFQLFVP